VDYLDDVLHWFSELLWPTRCIGCGVFGTPLCAPCLSRVSPLRMQPCPACRRPGRDGIPCSACARRTHIGRLIAVAPMEGLIESAVHALKYRGMRTLAVPLGDWAASVIGLRADTALMFGANPLIIPVPLHPSRLRERDYNQSALLAHRLAIIAAMPHDETALRRVRHTSSQVKTHSRVERLDNMRGAFAVVRPEAIADRDIILVDDVYTTGATSEDCARALTEAGARSVSVITLARG
jgi:ComF family protein